jgi:glycosyltransferase involved in cell wall biosynthesis
LLDFARRAGDHGIDAVVVLPKEGPLAAELRRSGVHAVLAPADERFLNVTQRGLWSLNSAIETVRGSWRWSRAISRALEELKAAGSAQPRILYSNGFKAHLACALVAGMPRVWHLREFPPEGLRTAWRLLAGSLPDAGIANSRAVAESWGEARTTALTVVLNGVDLERFRPADRTYWIHDQAGIPRGARLVGMPDVFARWKGQLEVIEAFELAAARIPDAHLVMAGGPIYDTVAERGFAEELVHRVSRSLRDRIHFLGFQSEPWRLYPEFELVVHFSTRPEPFGRVVAEALASGTPVIAARAGGPVELVDDRVTGWLVSPGDTTELAETLVGALSEDRTEMRPACRRAAAARLSAERYAQEVADVLKRLARRDRQ